MIKEIKYPYGFIYITTNMVNGKRYIGQKMFRKGWLFYMGSGKSIVKAIKKYGKQNFIRDIVAIAYSKEELNKLEAEWIYNYGATKNNNFYNIADGGGGNVLAGKPQNEIDDAKRKMSYSHKGNKNYFYGRRHTEESKVKMRKNHINTKAVDKPVICITTNKKFESIVQAGIYYKIQSPYHISDNCKNKRHYCGKLEDGTKLVWMFYDNYITQTKQAS